MRGLSRFDKVSVTVGEVVADLVQDGQVVGRYGLTQAGRLSAPLPNRHLEELLWR